MFRKDPNFAKMGVSQQNEKKTFVSNVACYIPFDRKLYNKQYLKCNYSRRMHT